MDGESFQEAICGCGATFSARTFVVLGRPMFTQKWCINCEAENLRAAQAQEEAKASAAKLEAWDAICPALYRVTDMADPRLSQDCVRATVGWVDTNDGRGLGMRGRSGAGKTRLAFMLLRRLFFAGGSCEAVSATKLASLCVDMHDDEPTVKNGARDKLRRIRGVRYLLLDDLGKQKFTDRAETELYDLIETRTSNLLPTIWTANVTSAELAGMMGKDRSEPIMRRLTEFSEVVST